MNIVLGSSFRTAAAVLLLFCFGCSAQLTSIICFDVYLVSMVFPQLAKASPYFLLLLVLQLCAAQEHLCPVENPTSTARRVLMLYDHNLYRSRIAQGLAIHSGSNPLPKGSNVYKVEWSCHLEELASQAVRGCPTKRMPNTAYGQNYEFIETDDNFDLDNPYPLALERWVSPMMSKHFESDVVTFKGGRDIQSFANMVRANTTRIGCSSARCGSFAAIACFYDSPDIQENEVIYKRGEGCSFDFDCTTYSGSTCDAESGMCITADTTEVPETLYTTILPNFDGGSASPLPPQKKRVTEPGFMIQTNGSNTMCPQNLGMIDQFRVRVLEMHNFRRSELAKGMVRRIGGNYLPSAANMVKMRYNCALEAFAISHAAKCTFNESDPASRMDMGENVAAVPFEHALTYQEAIRWSITYWWKPIRRHFGVMGRLVTFREKHVGQPISNFAQMAWAETHEIGCGLVKCGDVFNMVCRYIPSGKHLQHVLYDVGVPCSACPSDMMCEHKTGLCVQQPNSSALHGYSWFWMVLLFVLCAYFMR